MKNTLFTLLISVLISACSSLSLSTDYDNKIDFSNLKTYRWHAENDHNKASLKYLDNIIDQRIRSTIDQQLQKQHYIKQNEGTVDFWVNYSVVLEDRVDIRTYNNYNGMSPGFYGYRAGFGYHRGAFNTGSNTQVTHFKQGTLIIDIINPETDQLMWRGFADGRLPKNSDKAERDTLAQQYVAKILSKFPPKE